MPPRDRARILRDPTRSFRTPAIAGGLFAVDRKWFVELGAYDPGMAVSPSMRSFEVPIYRFS